MTADHTTDTPPNKPSSVLIIEDDPVMSRYLAVSLEKQGYQMHQATNGKMGLERASELRPDLILLDLGLPDMTGLEVLSQLQEWSRAPVVVLSATEEEEIKVQALDGGACDYVTKPVGLPELLARIRVALRHAARTAAEEGAIRQFGSVEMDLLHHRVLRGGQEVRLTPTQYKMLSLLVRRVGQVVTHRQMLREVWGPEYATETNYLRVYMKQLREKLEDDPAEPRYLLNEPGIGYRLQPDGQLNT